MELTLITAFIAFAFESTARVADGAIEARRWEVRFTADIVAQAGATPNGIRSLTRHYLRRR